MKIPVFLFFTLFIFNFIYLNTIKHTELNKKFGNSLSSPSITEELIAKIIYKEISIDDFFINYAYKVDINSLKEIAFTLFFDYRLANKSKKKFFDNYYEIISSTDLPEKELLIFFQDYWDQDMYVNEFDREFYLTSYLSSYEFITSLIKYFAECPEYIEMSKFEDIFETFLNLYDRFIGFDNEFIVKPDQKKILLNILFDVNTEIINKHKNRDYIKSMIIITYKLSKKYSKSILRINKI